MDLSRPWLRRLGAVLTALVLVVLTFGASLDSLVCRDEAGAVFAASASASPTSIVDNAHHQHEEDAAEACLQGHCHHAAQYLPSPRMAAHPPALVLVSAYSPGGEQAPTSDLTYGLMRPPRA